MTLKDQQKCANKYLKMVTETWKQRKLAAKEDDKFLFDKLWDTGEEELFWKISQRKLQKTHKMLRYSKEELHELPYVEDGGSFHNILKHNVGKIYMLVNYQSHLIAKEFFPKDANGFRFNDISKADWDFCEPSILYCVG